MVLAAKLEIVTGFLSTVQGFRNSQPRNLNVFLYWFRAAGQKNNGNYNDNSSINVSFQGGTMFFGSVPVQECNKLRDQKPWWVPQDSINCVCINVKTKTPGQKSLPRKEGPTNIVSLGPQEREKLEKKIITSVIGILDVIRDMREIFSNRDNGLLTPLNPHLFF